MSARDIDPRLSGGARYLRAMESSARKTVTKLRGLGIDEGSCRMLVAGYGAGLAMHSMMDLERTDEEIIALLLQKLAEVRKAHNTANGIEPSRIIRPDGIT